MITVRSELRKFTWRRAVRVAAFVLAFFCIFDLFLYHFQYSLVPEKMRRNPPDSSAWLQFCIEEMPQQSARKRVFFLGDSTVQGSNRIPITASTPQQLRRIITQSEEWRDARVFNFGLVGAMPADMLAALLLLRDRHADALVICLNHRDYGYEDINPMHFPNLVSNFSRAELADIPVLLESYDARGWPTRTVEKASLALRRVWFFYRFHGIWRDYVSSHDFRHALRGKKYRGNTGWKKEEIRLERYTGLRENYARIEKTLAKRKRKVDNTISRLAGLLAERNIPVLFFMNPADFRFVEGVVGIDGTTGRRAIAEMFRAAESAASDADGKITVRDYSFALEPQVCFLDQEHMTAKGTARLARLIAEDFFGIRPGKAERTQGERDK